MYKADNLFKILWDVSGMQLNISIDYKSTIQSAAK